MKKANRQIESTPTVFVSYAREDDRFVTDLVTRLKDKGVEPKGDWLLTPGEEYEKRLRELNLASHSFVFVISPDSIRSQACREEISVAVEHKKQILPISRRDHEDDNLLDSALRAHQWIFFREADDPQHAIDELLKAMKTDFDLVDTHSRLLVAAENWHAHGRNRSYLWRKEGLRNAEGWLAAVSAQPDKLPQPTQLEVEFIFTSQRARSRGMRTGLGIALSVALALVLLSVFAWVQRGQAKTNETEALVQKTKAVENADEANKQRGIAEVNLSEANEQKKKAEDNLKEAKRQQAEAEKQKRKAEENLAEAKRQQAEAVSQRKKAEDNLAEANRQKAEAERQTKIANDQRKEAEDRGRKLQKSYSEVAYRAGSQMLTNGDYGTGVAYLGRALAINPANAAAADRLFTLLTTKDPPLLVRRITPQQKVTEFDISSDGESIATISDQGEVSLWKGELPQIKFDLNSQKAQTLRFIPESSSFIVTTTGSILVFNSDNPKPAIVQKLPSAIVKYVVAEHWDKLAVACEDGALFIVPLKLNEQPRRLPLPKTDDLYALSFIHYGQGLAILSKRAFTTWDDLSEPVSTAKTETFLPDSQDIDIAAIATNGTYSYTELQGGLESVTPYVDVSIKAPSKETWKGRQYDYARAISLEFNREAMFLAVALDTEVTHILRRTGKDLTLRQEGLTGAGVHPTQELVYTTSNNGTVNLWNTVSGARICAPLRHSHPVLSARFSAAGKHLATLTADGSLNVWDISQREYSAEDKNIETTYLNSPKVGWLIKRDRQGRFELSDKQVGTDDVSWELSNASTKQSLLKYRHPLTDETKDWDAFKDRYPGMFPTPESALSEDGSTVVTIFGNSPARVWHTNSDQLVFELGANTDSSTYASKIYLTPNGSKALISYQVARQFQRPTVFYQIFSLVDGKSLTGRVQLIPGQHLLDVSSNMERVIIGQESSVFVRNAYDSHLIGQEIKQSDRIGAAAFFHDGRSLCTVSYDGSARIWDTETGFPLSESLTFAGDPGSTRRNWEAVHSGQPKADDYDFSIPKPIFLDDERRLAIPYEHLGDTKQIWDISMRADVEDTKVLVELATLIYGQRFDDSDTVELKVQPTAAELRQRFAQYEQRENDIGKLIKWFLADRTSRKATAFGGGKEN